MNIGDRIRLARKDRGLSQPALAELCGWQSQSRVSHYENNNREPSFSDMDKIASALNVPTEWLLTGGGLLDTGIVPSGRNSLGQPNGLPIKLIQNLQELTPEQLAHVAQFVEGQAAINKVQQLQEDHPVGLLEGFKKEK